MSEFITQGDIVSGEVPRKLLEIKKNKKTGKLTLNSDHDLVIYFHEGSPVHAESSDEQATLERMLLENGKISKDDYDRIISGAEGQERDTASVIAATGLISPHELSSILESRLREKIMGGLTFARGSYSFEELGEVTDKSVPSGISVHGAVLEMLTSALNTSGAGQGQIRYDVSPDLAGSAGELNLGPGDLRIVQMLSRKSDIDHILNSEEIDRQRVLTLLVFLSLCGYVTLHDHSIEELLEQEVSESKMETKNNRFEIDIPDFSGEDSDSSLNSEPGTVSADMGTSSPVDKEEISNDQHEYNQDSGTEPIGIDISGMNLSTDSDNEKASSTETSVINTQIPDSKDREALIAEINDFYDFISDERDSYRVLGVHEDSSDGHIKDAYFSLVKKFHPDANPDFPKDVVYKTEEIFTNLTQAYENIATEEKRSTYKVMKEIESSGDSPTSMYNAEKFFNEGKRLIKGRSYTAAREKFISALELNPKDPAYLGAATWSEFLAAEDKKSTLKKLIKELEKAVTMNKRIADNFYYLGTLYKYDNDMDRAERNFRKALEIDPGYIQAKRELRLIQIRSKDGSKHSKRRGKGFWSRLFGR